MVMLFRFRTLSVIALLSISLHHLQAQQRPPSIVTTLTDVVNAVQFSHDGSTLAIARGSREDNRVELWDVRTGVLRQLIKGFDGVVWSVSFSPDDLILVTASAGTHPQKVAEKPTSRGGRWFTELKWWNASTGELENRLESSDSERLSLAAVYSPDGKSLAISDRRFPVTPRRIDFAGPTARASYGTPLGFPRNRSGFFDARLELADAATGARKLKLKDGFDNSPLPILMGATGSDLFSLDAARHVRSAIFSPDGKLLAAWKGDEVRIWDPDNGTEILKLKKFKGRVTAIAFSPDSQLIAAAIAQISFKTGNVRLRSEVHIWEVATGAPRQVFPLHTDAVPSLFFTKNGRQLLAGGLEFKNGVPYAGIELIGAQAGSLGEIVSTQSSTNSSLALSPDGLLLAFQTDASTVQLLNTTDWRTRNTFGTDEETNSDASLRRFMVSVRSVPAVAFGPDGKTVAGEIEQGGIKSWDVRTGEVKKSIAADAETGTVAAISSDGSTVAEVSSEQEVRVWNVASGAHTVVPLASRDVTAVSLSADGKTLAIAVANGISIIDTARPTIRHQINTSGISISSVVLSADGARVAGATDSVVNVWATNDGRLLTKIAISGASALQFKSSDQIAVGSKAGTVSIWNVANASSSFEAKKHDSAVNAIVFSPDGTLMATGGDDRIAIIWDLGFGKPRRTLKGHDLAITSLSFSPDATRLAVGSGNASVVLWRVETGKLDRVLK